MDKIRQAAQNLDQKAKKAEQAAKTQAGAVQGAFANAVNAAQTNAHVQAESVQGAFANAVNAAQTTVQGATQQVSQQATAAHDEISEVIGQLTGALKNDPQLLQQFMSNPAQAVQSLLGSQQPAPGAQAQVAQTLTQHGAGADINSVLGSLSTLFGSNHDEASANHQSSGNPLDALSSVLGSLTGGNNAQQGNVAGGIMNMLSSFFK